jgi:hypothetical protein
MSEMKVKVLDDTLESKSVQEVEQDLLKKHEQEQQEEAVNENETVKEKETTTETAENQTVEQGEQESEAKEFTEKDVLSYIKDRYNREINSVEDLFEARAEAEELPEDVSAFLKYKKETGRGIQDFMSLNKDYDSMNPDQILADYYSATEDDLDKEDIDYLLNEKFAYDEDVDEEKDIKQRQIAKKRELAKAKKYFNELKETYKVPLESSGGLVSEGEKEDYEAYKKYIQESKSIEEETLKRSEYFQKKTDEVFNDFKGFDFKIGDQDLVYLPGDTKEIKNTQLDINNFISKYLDDNGMISDAAGYHKSIAVAMNPDKFARYFYEQGQANAIDDVTKKAKNIDMGVRQAPQDMNKSGFSVRALDNSSGRGLKIKSNKNN